MRFALWLCPMNDLLSQVPHLLRSAVTFHSPLAPTTPLPWTLVPQHSSNYSINVCSIQVLSENSHGSLIMWSNEVTALAWYLSPLMDVGSAMTALVYSKLLCDGLFNVNPPNSSRSTPSASVLIYLIYLYILCPTSGTACSCYSKAFDENWF